MTHNAKVFFTRRRLVAAWAPWYREVWNKPEQFAEFLRIHREAEQKEYE